MPQVSAYIFLILAFEHIKLCYDEKCLMGSTFLIVPIAIVLSVNNPQHFCLVLTIKLISPTLNKGLSILNQSFFCVSIEKSMINNKKNSQSFFLIYVKEFCQFYTKTDFEAYQQDLLN